MTTHGGHGERAEELDRHSGAQRNAFYGHVVTLATDHGQVAQRSTLTAGRKQILTGLDLPESPRFFDFAPTNA